MARAGIWPADALLIAGDLVESARATRHTASFLESQFESIPHVPIFIAPGSHDPYGADSFYASHVWPSNVTVFDSPRWSSRSVAGKNLTVHGFAFDGPEISKNPFGLLRIKKGDREGVHVAVGYGSEKTHQPLLRGSRASFSAKDAAVEGLAYLALGHSHNRAEIRGDFPTVMCYSGAPEGHGFAEPEVRNYLEVEIEGEDVRVSPVASSHLVYAAYSVGCSGLDTSEDLIAAIRAVCKKRKSAQIVRVTLREACSFELRNEFGAIREALAQDFETLELVDQTDPVEDYAELGKGESSLGGLIRTLNEELADATKEERKLLLERAREIGLTAFRNLNAEIQGLEV